MEANRTAKSSPASNIAIYAIQLLCVLLVVILVQVLELTLLEKKYDLFTSGFLQPYSYLNWMDRGKFILVSLWIDITVIGGISLLWFWVSDRLKINLQMAAYNFTYICASFMAIWLGIKFKVLSYFNDTLNFMIIKNLAGGSLLDALSYVANETTILGIGGIFLLSAYLLGLNLVKRYQGQAETGITFTVSRKKHQGWVLLAGLLTVSLMAYINSNAFMRYGLGKKTTYIMLSKALDELTDLDRDGYGLFRFPIDPKNLDPLIYPGALDIPGNGIDEDGYNGDFVWDGPEIDPMAKLTPIPGKHILLIVLESARGDLLGKNWNGRPVSPYITQLAQTGSSVDYAYSHTGFTVTSIRALLSRTISSRNDLVILADYLKRAEYSLSFLSGQDESFGGMDTSTGMIASGHYLFDARSALEDRVYASKDPASIRLSEDRIVQQFNARASKVDWGKPQFFYINLQAAHFPYTHPGMPALINSTPIERSEINKDNLKLLQATYWNAIAVADNAVGQIIEQLKQQGVYQNSVVAVVGDHGESIFDDHFLGHGHALNQAQTRIPLVLSRPGVEINQAVGQIDIAELLVRVATNRFDKDEWGKQENPILQFVGSLNRPQLIGTVSHGDIRTILDFRTRKVFFSDLQRWEDFDRAINDPDLKQRTSKLIDIWERARWKDYLSRPRSQSRPD
ncbi:MAG: sulfatase-like hydrolase/transferase [Gammaproteobacteria bacterium]|nr:sulfatase-like hydrolase/transferase [Gammaproteobacteria bacterium]